MIAQQIFLFQAALNCSPSWMEGFTKEASQAYLGFAKRRDKILGRCANTWIPGSAWQVPPIGRHSIPDRNLGIKGILYIRVLEGSSVGRIILRICDMLGSGTMHAI